MNHRGVAYGYRPNNNVYYANIEDMTFKTLTDVENVLESLKKEILEKGFATVAEYYRLTGGTIVASDYKYGWTDMLDCRITSTRYGYLLSMYAPKDINIDKNPLQEIYNMLQDVGEEDAYDILIETKRYLSDAL